MPKTDPRKEKKIPSRQHALASSPVALAHPTLLSQFHKSAHSQKLQSEITKDEAYTTPRGWASPRDR
jgi:hypothetical protein